MKEIENQTEKYSKARAVLAAIVAALEDELRAVKRKCIPGIRRQVAAVKDQEAELREMIEESPEHFERPRTRTLHGIRVGFRKANGKIEYDDADRVVALIRKHFRDKFDELVKVTEKPNKEALENLEAADLKKLGVTITGSGDVVQIKDSTGAVDKLVEALLKDEPEEDA